VLVGGKPHVVHGISHSNHHVVANEGKDSGSPEPLNLVMRGRACWFWLSERDHLLTVQTEDNGMNFSVSTNRSKFAKQVHIAYCRSVVVTYCRIKGKPLLNDVLATQLSNGVILSL
jgi:hypothetical protein